MRMLIRATIPNESGNALVKSGKMGAVVEEIMAALKPEVAFFCVNNGRRSANFIVNMQDSSQMVDVAEPLFLAVNAEVEMQPIMMADDLQKGGQAFPNLVQKYG